MRPLTRRILLLSHLFTESSNQHRNRLRIFLAMKCKRSIDGPFHSDDASSGEVSIERSTFTNQGESIALFHQHLHFCRMGCARMFVNFYTHIIEKL